MATTRIVVIGCLTGLLIRHTTAMGGTLFESVASLLGIAVNNSTGGFGLYLEYQVAIGSLLRSLFYLVILPYIFTHSFKAASLYIVVFCVLIIAINITQFDFDSGMRASRSFGMRIGAIVAIRIAIKLHSTVEPIAVYHQWRYINHPKDWL